MLPGFNSGQLSPGSSLGQAPNYSSSPAAPSYPAGQAPSRNADPQQGYPSLPSDNEEDSSFIAADDDSADEQAAAAAADNSCELAVEGPTEASTYGDLSAQDEAKQRSAVTVTADESAAADVEAEKALMDSLSQEDSGIQVQSPESLSGEPRIKAAEAAATAAEATTKASEAMTKVTKNGLQSAPGGSGILNEYLRRMHFSKEIPLPAPVPAPSPPQGASAPVSMPRRWSKTNSYPDGEFASLICSSAHHLCKQEEYHECCIACSRIG